MDLKDLDLIDKGEKVVFFRGVKSKKIPEGKIGTIKNAKILHYVNSKTQEKEMTVLYDVELPDGKIHRTQSRCIMRISDWENPSCRASKLKEKKKEWIEGSANQGW